MPITPNARTNKETTLFRPVPGLANVPIPRCTPIQVNSANGETADVSVDLDGGTIHGLIAVSAYLPPPTDCP